MTPNCKIILVAIARANRKLKLMNSYQNYYACSSAPLLLYTYVHTVHDTRTVRNEKYVPFKYLCTISGTDDINNNNNSHIIIILK
jgi:hypothetical protein